MLLSIGSRALKLFLCSTILFLISFGSCKKEENTPPVTPSPADTSEPQQYETPFNGVPATKDIVMYEINELAFSHSGDFSGILSRLDSIKALGVNVIWLMPIHPIGEIKTVHSPYCVKNYKEVNPAYGTLENLRTLVRESHKKGMAVILDWVANHTSWDNPWIQHKAWYTQNSYGEIISPAGTNWQDVADLNYDNQEMRKEMIKAMKFWVLTANIDGYRCDAADMVPFDFWKQAIDSLENIPGHDIIMLAEGARKDHFTAGFQMNFSWDFMAKCKQVFTASLSPSSLYQAHLDEYEGIPEGSEKLRFTSNHDICAWEGTPLDQFGGKEASMAAFVLTSFMGGVPLLYNGQEVGSSVKLPFFSALPIDWNTNPGMFSDYKVIMKIRSEHPSLKTGDITWYPDQDIAVFTKVAGDDQMLILVNTRNSMQEFTIPGQLSGTNWYNAANGEAATLAGNIALQPFEYLILHK